MPRRKTQPGEKRVPDLDWFLPEFFASRVISKSHRRGFKQALSFLEKYTLEVARKKYMPMDKYDLKFFTRFTIWLQQQKKAKGGRPKRGNIPVHHPTDKPLSERTKGMIVSRLHTIFKSAFKDEEVIERNPFDRYDMNKLGRLLPMTIDMLDRKVEKIDLTRIETESQANDELERIRLIMLFQRWTGFAYKDLNTQDVKGCIRTIDKKEMLIYNRAKNGQLAMVPMFKETKYILKQLDFQVNPGSYSYYRNQVRTVFASYGLNVDELGTHTMRHVFGSEMLEKGFTMEGVSRMMGHSSVSETENTYARINPSKILSDLNRIENVQSPGNLQDNEKVAS